MATLVSPQLRSVADAVVKKSGLSSAVLSGIVPDSRHLDNGGYHCSIKDLIRFGNGNDYSNTRIDDKGFNTQYGAAFDVTMSTADMKKAHKRVYAVWKDRSDPRRKYINAVNCWDGSGDAVRLDFKKNTAGYASPDHKWHTHNDMPRRYLLDPKAARAWISMYAGEGKATWIAREERPAAKPTESAPVKTPATKPVASTKPAAKPAPKVYKPGSRVLQYTPGKAVLKGEDVTFVQRFIGAAHAGAADGVAGAKFRAGVIWYQRMRGLKADGAVGAATWRAMGIKNAL
jgi:hypothetical protein